MKRFFLTLILILSIFLPKSLTAEDFWKVDISSAKDIDNWISSLTQEECLGQIFLLGYSSNAIDAEVIRFWSEKNIGGMKIFGWNSGVVKNMVDSINRVQNAFAATKQKIPVFVATDQEGGWVRHIYNETTVTPGNMSIAATGILQDSYQSAVYIGAELKALGINMNFAPTIDLFTNPKSTVIGPRSFSDDPNTVAMMAIAYFQGMKSEGIIATAKHFPGHGNTSEDSHTSLPSMPQSLEELIASDLVPYEALIKEGLPAIMVGHLAFPKITGDQTPASLSPFFLKDMLRTRMGFNGLVITDDIYMDGILESTGDIGEACLKALMAGCDFLMISRSFSNQKEAYYRVLSAMQNDLAIATRIREACARVLKLKLEYLRRADGVPLNNSFEKNKSLLKSADAEHYFRNQAFRSVTLLRKDPSAKYSNLFGSVLIVSQYPEFLAEGKKRFPSADTWFFNYDPFFTANESDIETVKERSAHYDLIIFGLANPNSLQVLKALEGRNVIVLSMLSPSYLREVPWVKDVYLLYSSSPYSITAGFSALIGDYTPKGKIPVKWLK